MDDFIKRLLGYDWRGKERTRTAHEAATEIERKSNVIKSALYGLDSGFDPSFAAKILREEMKIAP